MEFKNRTFYSVVPNDQQYKIGLNTCTMKIDKYGSYQSGGMYFTNQSQLGCFYKCGELVAIIRIPDNAHVVKESYASGRWRADQIIIDRFESIDTYWSDEFFCLDACRQDGMALQFVKEQTEEICLEACRQDGMALQFVKEQTEEMCLKAVTQDPLLLEFVKEQTEEICLKAVEQNGMALEYVKEQTEELCLEALIQNGYAFTVCQYPNQRNMFASIEILWMCVTVCQCPNR
jgi:hypothetical protein